MSPNLRFLGASLLGMTGTLYQNLFDKTLRGFCVDCDLGSYAILFLIIVLVVRFVCKVPPFLPRSVASGSDLPVVRLFHVTVGPALVC